MKNMTAGLQKTGLLWAMLKDHLIENLFLEKPCYLQMMKLQMVKYHRYVHVAAVLGAALGVGAWPPNVCRSM